MVVELLRIFRNAKTLQEVIYGPAGPEAERAFMEAQALVRQPKISTASLLGRRKFGSLAAFRKAVARNLDRLEERGLANSQDGYQDVMNGIATDILQRQNHRLNRRKELDSLRATQSKLDVKTHFYKETLEYYNRYVQACLSNLAAGRSRRQSSAGLQAQPVAGEEGRTLK